MKRKGVYLLIVLLLSVVSSFTLIYSQHSFINLNEWQSGKAKSRLLLNGSFEYLFERSPLARGRLSLAKYYNYHSVELREPLSFDSLELDYWLNSPQAWLDLILSDESENSIVVRFGAVDAKGIARVYSRPSEGPFEVLTETQASLKVSKKVRLQLKRDHNSIEVFLDDKPLLKTRHDYLIDPKMKIGFRSGPCCTSIDNVLVFNSDSRILKESFNPSGPFFTFLVSHFVFFFFLFIMLGKIKHLGSPTFLATQAFVLFLIYFSFDYFLWTERPYLAHAKAFADGKYQQNLFEKIRIKISDRLYEFYGIEINRTKLRNNDYPIEPVFVEGYFCNNKCKIIEDTQKVKDLWVKTKDQCYWLLTLGGSQALGSGASRWETTYFNLLQQKVRRQKVGTCVVAINLASIAAKLDFLSQKLINNYSFLRPNFTIALVGVNGGTEEFKTHALPFLKLLKERSEKLALVSAVTPEDNWTLSEKRKELKRASSQLAIHYLPLHEKINGSGINADDWYWWDDCCHLTDMGQKSMAEEIYSFLQPRL